GGDACGQRCREVCMAPAAVAGPSGIAYGWEGFCLKIVHAGNLLGTSDAYGEGDKAEGGVTADACK
ncbi:MAG: hypothetical protein UHS51_02365, partial [Atopobiaceae bacterium]|nr:hypothetical protein [Atopobiaceae bacterium]